MAESSCIPLSLVEELGRVGAVSDESTDADSTSEERSSVECHSRSEGGSASSSEAQQVASPNFPCTPRQGNVWWQLVWCHERCHKKDCNEKRNLFDEVAEGLGAQPLAIKKAAKFAAWLAQAQRPPYALLTDWREVKPCLEAAALHQQSNRPAFTVIFCELPKHIERATAWAQGLPSRRDPVHICKDVRCLKPLIASLAMELLGGVALRARAVLQMRPPGNFGTPPRKLALEPHLATEATTYGSPSCLDTAEEDTEKEYEDIRKQRDCMWLQQVQPVSYVIGAQVPAPWAVLSPALGVDQWAAMPQMAMLGQVPGAPGSPCENPQALKAMLMSAMPDHYDD